jgi:nucleotide-binding universal stress UspA family protein
MAKNLKTIVIGTTLTPGSEGIVRTGAAIARATGASPWLVHAFAPPAFPSELGVVDGHWIEVQTQELNQRLMRQARQAGLEELPGFSSGQAFLALGAAHHEIVDLARRVQADLIVVGASEAGAIHRAFLGSTADRVVRKAPCPVFVVRSETAFPPAQALIPVDLSPASANALRWGVSFLRQTGGGTPIETTALFVLNPLEVAGSLQFTESQMARFAREEMHRFVAANAPSAGAVACRVVSGYPREEILFATTEQQEDLVILGTHGRSGLERMMIGSVASQVLERAFCNVIVVPPAAEALQQSLAEDEEKAGADWRFVSDESPTAAAGDLVQ